jgi:transposase
MMLNEDLSEDLKEYIHNLERKIAHLEKDLEKERADKETSRQLNKKLKKENEKLKKELAQLQGSAPVLAGSDKTAEAGGVPTSKTFYRRNREPEGDKKPTGGQPGHQGHGRKKPTPNEPPTNVPLEICPECGAPLGEPIKGAEQKRTVTDIPLPHHIVYEIVYPRYWCGECKKLVRGEAPWMPPNQQFGPAVACWIAYQRMIGLSIEKLQSDLLETYGITMSKSTVLKLEKWVADTLHEDYEKIHEAVVKSSAVNADETSFRIGGMNGWLWVFTSTVGSYYVVAPTRGHKVPEEVLEGFEGVLGRDAWKPYDVVKCEGHQLDFLHINRWLERGEIKHRIEPRTLLSSRSAKLTKPGRPPKQFIDFADGIRSILKRAIEYTENDPPPSMEERKNACKEFQKEMKTFLNRKWTDADAVRISKELRKRLDMLFTFMDHEGVPWHNNDAERAIRQGVLHRKISGGRRTWTGAEVFEVILSTYETAKKKGERFIETVRAKFDPPSGVVSCEAGAS